VELEGKAHLLCCDTNTDALSVLGMLKRLPELSFSSEQIDIDECSPSSNNLEEVFEWSLATILSSWCNKFPRRNQNRRGHDFNGNLDSVVSPSLSIECFILCLADIRDFGRALRSCVKR
jgi:hypothetical protein